MRKINIDPEAIVITVLIVFVAIGIFFLGDHLAKTRAEEEAYASMTAEERAEYDAPYTTEYEIVRVNKYAIVRTTRLGGGRGHGVFYEVIYEDQNGNIFTIEAFNPNYTNSNIVLGADEDKLTINRRSENNPVTTLYLSEATLASMDLAS